MSNNGQKKAPEEELFLGKSFCCPANAMYLLVKYLGTFLNQSNVYLFHFRQFYPGLAVDASEPYKKTR